MHPGGAPWPWGWLGAYSRAHYSYCRVSSVRTDVTSVRALDCTRFLSGGIPPGRWVGHKPNKAHAAQTGRGGLARNGGAPASGL
eukprot:1173870-Prymnesium_polylepis.1